MNKEKGLDVSFYERDTVLVAKDLLGKFLRRTTTEGERLGGMIVEVEAYLPFDDEAAHNYVGKTERNSVLFERAGLAYVHSIHRYHCIDIVTESEGIPGSVLIRAIIPQEGIDLMKLNRNKIDANGLVDGPGKICQALDITRAQNGIDITDPASEIIVIDKDVKISEKEIMTGPRVGISKATDKLLRFYLK